MGDRDLQSDIELGRVEVPLGSALDAVGEAIQQGESKYIRWFPLLGGSGGAASVGGGSGKGGGGGGKDSEKKNDKEFGKYYTPCIRLSLMWEPDEDNMVSSSATTKAQSGGSVEAGTAGIKTGKTKNSTSYENLRGGEGYIEASFGSISCSLIDSVRARELLSLSINDSEVKYVGRAS